MARGKSSKFIKVLTSKDISLIKQLSRTGLSSREQIKSHLGLNDDRINKLANSKYISISKEVVNGKTRDIIKLEIKGKKYSKENLGTQFFPKVQNNHLYHDLKLTDMYFSYDVDVRETWIPENQIVAQLKFDFPELTLETCVDAMIVQNGSLVAVESVGKSYDDEIMEMKHDIAFNYLNCDRMDTA